MGLFWLGTLFCAACASGKATLDWVSHPVLPGDTVMVSGGGFSDSPVVTLAPLGSCAGTRSTSLSPTDVSANGLMFRLPNRTARCLNRDQDPYDRYTVSVDGSDAIPLNEPDVWWFLGDQGAASTPGGWLRVFGRSLGAQRDTLSSSKVGSLEACARRALSERNFDEVRRLVESMEAQARAPPATRKGGAPAPGETWLRLTLLSGHGNDERSRDPVLVQSPPGNTTEFAAAFGLPGSLSPGRYKAEISADGGVWWSQLTMFVSPDEPLRDHVTLVPPPVWKPDVFTVDCKTNLPVFERPCGWVGARSRKELDAALDAARANGGGVVLLPRGQYYIDGPIVVPDGVRLRGEEASLVSVYFREDNMDTAPQPGYVYSDGNRWAVEDLTLYISHFYHSVIFVGPECTSFELLGVRVRAVAYAMLGDPCKGANGRGERLADYNAKDLGEVVYLAGNDNFKILDCDLLGTNIIIHTGRNPGVQPSATNGIIARNVLYNANAAHWFDDIKQVIFERNRILPGGTTTSWGNNIDNYGDGYAQHVYHAHNTFERVWAGDREMMTFDPVNGHYFGHAVAVNQTVFQLTNGNGLAVNASLGGALSVLDGTGAGQYRRIVAVPNNETVIVDRPFATPLDATSLVQFGPFKGKIIFDDNKYTDGGGFQTYATAHDVIVSRHRFERTEGLLSWGRATPPSVFCPNIHVEFVDNTVVEGNHLWNYNGSYPYPHPKTVEPYFIGVLGSDQDPQPCEPYPHGPPGNCTPSPAAAFQGPINHFVAIRRNKIESNGGVVVRGHSLNVLVEGNVIHQSAVSVHVNGTHTSHVVVTGNTCDTDDAALLGSDCA